MSKRYINSAIHILLDSETPIARLTGRVRLEKSNGKGIVCHEVEVIIPDQGLMRQCYYFLDLGVWVTMGGGYRSGMISVDVIP